MVLSGMGHELPEASNMLVKHVTSFSQERHQHCWEHCHSLQLSPSSEPHPAACRKYGGQRWGGFVLDKLRGGAQSNGASSPVEALLDNQPVSREQFEGLLETIDQGLRALPATGSVQPVSQQHFGG